MLTSSSSDGVRESVEKRSPPYTVCHSVHEWPQTESEEGEAENKLLLRTKKGAGALALQSLPYPSATLRKMQRLVSNRS